MRENINSVETSFWDGQRRDCTKAAIHVGYDFGEWGMPGTNPCTRPGVTNMARLVGLTRVPKTNFKKRARELTFRLWNAHMGVCVLLSLRRKSRRSLDKYSLSLSQILNVSKDIDVDKDNVSIHWGKRKFVDPDNISQCNLIYHHERELSSLSAEEGSFGNLKKQSTLSLGGLVPASPLIGLPEFSHLGWGHWFTLRDLEQATNRFSTENIIGEGGYGVVYRGRLINGTEVVVKKLLNNLGQAEKEFRVEVEAIGHVRHKASCTSSWILRRRSSQAACV
ncbi:hypothetical protein VNO77_14846 [Canavalia gladiata]|uniref:non-specific serine/threonine protein kinase n=1 Tax=Canavalia gladiata TaxID=3824 RepID=A0AAN9QVK9_CANGL